MLGRHGFGLSKWEDVSSNEDDVKSVRNKGSKYGNCSIEYLFQESTVHGVDAGLGAVHLIDFSTRQQ